MLVIPRLTIELSEDGWGRTSGQPCLVIKIEPLTTGDDIRSISYYYNDGSGPHSQQLDVDIIESIETQFYSEPDKLIWDFEDRRSVSLLAKLKGVMAELTPSEIQNMSSSYTTIFNLDVTRGVPNYHQRLIETFLAQVSVYLVINQLIYEDLIWKVLPYSFDPPFDTFDGRSLTYYAINYLTIPFEPMKVVSEQTFAQEVAWIINGFHNTWSKDYLLGTKQDTSKILYQVTNKVISVTTRNITRLTDHVNSTLSKCQELISERLEVVNQRTDQDDSRVTELERRVAELEERLSRPLPVVQDLSLEPVQTRPDYQSTPTNQTTSETIGQVHPVKSQPTLRPKPRLIRHHDGKPI